MTPEQVSVLSDIELNRAMIWLYPPKLMLLEDSGEDCFFIGARSSAYLGDFNLTMPLVFEHRVRVKTNFHKTMTIAKQLVSADMGGDYFNNKTAHKNPLRAICQCLVLIAMEGKE